MTHIDSGFNVSSGDDPGSPSEATKRIIITNNLLYRINDNESGRIFQNVGGGDKIAEDIYITNNTALLNEINLPGSYRNFATVGDSAPVARRYFFDNNIVSRAEYGLFGSGQGEGMEALDYYMRDYSFKNNLLIGESSDAYPAGTLFAPTYSSVFANPGSLDFHVKSAYSGRGANIDQVNSAVARALTGN